MKPLSVADFAKHAELAGVTLNGFIRYDASSPNVVYFGVTPQSCPQYPIPKDTIASLQVGAELPCHGPTMGVMWFAKIVLKSDAQGGGLANLVVALAATLKSQAVPLDAQAGWYFWICYENGSSFWSDRYISQSEAQTQWVLYGSAPSFKAGVQPTFYSDYPPKLGINPSCP